MAYAKGLGRAFLFDAEDLKANRAGHLSVEQARVFANVARVGRRNTRRVLPIFFLLLLGTVVATVVSSAPEDSGPALAVVGVMGTFMLLIVAFFYRRYARDRAVQEAGQVFSVEGPFDFDPSVSGIWRIRIGDVPFAVELLQYEALDQDAAYRAYFLPTTPNATLLSIEKA